MRIIAQELFYGIYERFFICPNQKNGSPVKKRNAKLLNAGPFVP